MYRLTEHEINVETAELDQAAHHTTPIPRSSTNQNDRASYEALVVAGVTTLGSGMTLDSSSSSSSSSSGEDEEHGEIKTLMEGGSTPGVRTPSSTMKIGGGRRAAGSLEIEGGRAGGKPGDALDPVVRARLISMWSLQNLALLMSYWTIGLVSMGGKEGGREGGRGGKEGGRGGIMFSILFFRNRALKFPPSFPPLDSP